MNIALLLFKSLAFISRDHCDNDHLLMSWKVMNPHLTLRYNLYQFGRMGNAGGKFSQVKPK